MNHIDKEYDKVSEMSVKLTHHLSCPGLHNPVKEEVPDYDELPEEEKPE